MKNSNSSNHSKGEKQMGNSIRQVSNNGNVEKLSSGRTLPVTDKGDASGKKTLPAGYVIGHRYHVIKLLGEGGMGAVYKVEEERRQGNIMRALKINKETSPDFLREATLPARLTHRNLHIVRPVYMGHDDELKADYIVMEYVKGESFSSIYRRVGWLTEQECLVVAYELCQALESLEVCRILHCDIKPSNIMLDVNGVVRLTDFGVSVGLDKGKSVIPQNGTPLYESPEQWQQEPGIDNRSDIFSLGATLYDFVTGQHAFPGKSTADVLAFRANHPEPSKPPFKANPLVSKEFSNLLMDMMAEDPEDRPGGSAYLLETLIELGCPSDEAERTAIMKNLLTRGPSGPIPEYVPDKKELVRKGLIGGGILLLVIIVFWICASLA